MEKGLKCIGVVAATTWSSWVSIKWFSWYSPDKRSSLEGSQESVIIEPWLSREKLSLPKCDTSDFDRSAFSSHAGKRSSHCKSRIPLKASYRSVDFAISTISKRAKVSPLKILDSCFGSRCPSAFQNIHHVGWGLFPEVPSRGSTPRRAKFFTKLQNLTTQCFMLVSINRFQPITDQTKCPSRSHTETGEGYLLETNTLERRSRRRSWPPTGSLTCSDNKGCKSPRTWHPSLRRNH